MTHVDGRDLRKATTLIADVVVVGSGPAGSVVAARMAATGAEVVVVEAGPWLTDADAPQSALGAMATAYRGMGATTTVGVPPTPYVQGRAVGGSSRINGAICWRLPRDVWDAWVAADGGLAEALPWAAIEDATDAVEAALHVAPTDPAIAGRKSRLFAAGAEALGLAHRPIRRNVVGCEGLGRCLQGCPRGHKRTADVAFLRPALRDGATVLSRTEVKRVVVGRRRALGVVARAEGGARVRVAARRAVVLAASAIQTPLLLRRSGLRHGPVGDHFQAHPGVSLMARFPEPVWAWEGATQGHEVTGLRHEGLKFETLGFGPGVLAARLPGVGRELSGGIEELAHWVDWGAAIKAAARGRVRRVLGRTVVTYTPRPEDVVRFRRAIAVMGRMAFAAGADAVVPAVRGVPEVVRDAAVLDALEASGPSHPAAYASAITHMFGTARMASDPGEGVVRPDFRHHGVEGLVVADSSVFPTNTGVNPMVPIMALARLCADRLAAE